ncbi:MAG: VCBS repeat-containing protein [Phycisphaerales bacterium]|nr:VCBS repeat-containing protein [Phycisphaerales bacterium]
MDDQARPRKPSVISFGLAAFGALLGIAGVPPRARAQPCMVSQRLFQGQVNITGDNAGEVAAADFNGDGLTDLAVAYYSSSLTILNQTCAGSFDVAASFAMAPSRVNSVSAADLDSDGDTDLIVALDGSGQIRAFFNDGAGHFTPGPSQGVLVYAANRQAAADIDGDSDVDLVVATGSGDNTRGAVEVFTNEGDGTFVQLPAIVLSLMPSRLCLADVDGDSRPDLLVGCFIPPGAMGRLILMRGVGGGVFGAEEIVADTLGVPNVFPVDLDSDQDLDLAVAHYNPRFIGGSDGLVTLLLNNGAAAFSITSQFPVGSRPWGILIRDLDSDGLADLILSRYHNSRVEFRPGMAGGGFGPVVTFDMPHPQDLVLADLDHDGFDDIVSGDFFTANIEVLFRQSADVQTDGVLSVGDVFEFLEAWFSREVRADRNRDCRITIDDLFRFLETWFGGCK